MKKISCIIIDDEPLALQLIEGYVDKTPFLDLKGKFSNAFDAILFLNNEKTDLVFLDVQMPDLNGLELSKKIKDNTRIVFTTAFEEYAIEGFKVEALDYLLKPFNYDDFFSASLKALRWFELVNSPDKQSSPQDDYIYVKSEYKHIKIILNDIIYIEGLKDYVKIWLRNAEKPVLSLMSLKSLENELPTNTFMRVHRSFIVNLNNIETIERGQIIMDNARITIAEQYRDAFYKHIEGKSIK